MENEKKKERVRKKYVERDRERNREGERERDGEIKSVSMWMREEKGGGIRFLEY